jgi:predicted permease
MAVSPGDYFDLRNSNTVFEDVTAYVPFSSDSLTEPGQPTVKLDTVHSTANFFKTFGIEPQMGRAFSPDEESHLDNVAMIANHYWKDNFGADPKILGRQVRLGGKLFTVVGVLPARLDDPMIFDRRVAFWLLDPTRLNFGKRNQAWYRVAARLKPGITVQQASANLTAIGLRLAHEYPETNNQRTFRLEPYPSSNMQGVGKQLTWMVMLLSGFVLVIACVNLANLQLVRAGGRSQEIAVRLALGSSRGAVVAMLLVESLVLSFGGGLLGLLVGKWSNIYIAKYLNIDMPLDLRVLVFTFAASALTGAAFGAVPAWIASRENVSLALKAGGRGTTSGRARRWFRQGLVVVELVLALTILSGAAYFVHGIYELTHQSLGWNADHALFGEITLDHDHFGEQGDPRSVAFGARLKEALEAIPGVQVAAVGTGFPAFGGRGSPYRLEGQPPPEKGKETMAESTNIAAGYFGIYEIQVVKGREFNDTDRIGAPPVVIVNETMAKKCWPGEDPIGKRIGSVDPAKPDWAEVVGVVKDFHNIFEFVQGGNGMKMFKPWAQNSHRFPSFHVKASSDPAALMDSVRKTMAAIAPDFALDYLMPGKAIVMDALSYFTFLRRVLVELSALGLALAAVGIYGVVATLVAERTKEIGIRMALGAQARSILLLFLRNGIALSLIGASLGAGAAVVLVRTLTKMFPILPGYSPWAIAPVALFLIIVAMVASWFPARRSTHVDPSTALRSE